VTLSDKDQFFENQYFTR